MPTLTDNYLRDCKQYRFERDDLQLYAISILQTISDNISLSHDPLWKKIKVFFKSKFFSPNITQTKGVYLWGQVGRGKTYLLDLFYKNLKFQEKKRWHFLEFMQFLHQEMRLLKSEADPLVKIAQRLKAQAKVICLDEFYVSDIADAMILGRLLEILFKEDVIVVASSNSKPDNLYLNGLQRQRFLTAIEAIKKNMFCIHMDGGFDYRTKLWEKLPIYYYPLSAAVTAEFLNTFKHVAQGRLQWATPLLIQNRHIATIAMGSSEAWFKFQVLCGAGRGSADYSELAQKFQTVFLSDIHVFQAEQEDELRRFIALVDEFHDKKIHLIISAAVDLEELYQGTALQFEFARTKSRLSYMQTAEYLELCVSAHPHTEAT